MSIVRVPHFSLPFRIVGAAAAVSEQDSVEEIVDCVQAIARCPQGHRVELPDFGVPDQTFRQGGADTTLVQAALARWEPRASAIATAEVEAAVSRVTVETHAGGPGQ